MKIKITQQFLLLGIFLVSTLGFTQALPVGAPTYYIVQDVFPTKVTTGTDITIVGGENFTTSTVVSIANIATGTEKPSNGGNQLNFKVTETGGGHNDKTLKINGLPVYRNSLHTDSLVKISYIKPSTRTYAEFRNYTVTEIFTDWDYNNNGYYRSDWYIEGTESTWPDDSHDLLAFTIVIGASYSSSGTSYTYSTGVNDSLLTAKGISFIPQEYKAYSTNGITGTPHSSNFLATADLIDGEENLRDLNDLVRGTVYDVIIDGKNGQGLDLGTGITNFNKEASIRFFSGNGSVGAVDDDVPDLLLTQIADPGDPDVYYYADIKGNVVGQPLKLEISRTSPKLYNWYVDLYRMDLSVPYDLSLPVVESFGNNDARPYRMIAFELSDFGITTDNIDEIGNINMLAGGAADIAFMAYNKAAFDIKSPVVDRLPVSRNICKIPSSTGVTFNLEASVEGPTGDVRETLRYQWYRNFDKIDGATSDSYSLPSVTSDDLLTYKVRVSNDFGAIDLPVTLSEGGTPTYWDGSTWNQPAALTDAGVVVNDSDRNLIFSEDYNVSTDLEGCDCRVLAGKSVVIPEGKSMKLYGAITVDPEILEETEEIDGETVVVNPYIPAGTFTLENNASLIQTKLVASNENSGEIKVKRTATELRANDYLYWSSPVDNFNLSEIPGSNGYRWDVNYSNPNGTEGNWVAHSGVMTPGSGYIKRVPSAADLTVGFEGVPTNGEITIPAYKSTLTDDLTGGGDWNLIGNPYPSSLRAITFLEANRDLGGAVYLWNQKVAASNTTDNPFYDNYAVNYGDQYVTYNGTGSTPDTDYAGNIASGQGFFIQVQSAASSPTTVTFSNDMRYDASEEAYDNSQFYRPDETNTVVGEVQKELIWLSLVNEANSSAVALVGYVEGATNDNDRMYDAVANGEGMRMYSVLGASKMVIQGRSLPFNETDTVPLGVDIPENGIYRIGLQDVSGEQFTNNEQAIYLEDTYTNTIHDLRESPYSFTGVEGSVLDRFVLRYTTSSLSVETYESNDTFVYVKDQQFYLKATENIKSIELYDITGKQLPAYDVSSNSNTYTGAFQYPRGVYVVIIKFTDNSVVSKKIIN
ncbi:T9SS type A sorting domain-containing protein [Bizionia sp. KMM 8389]